MEIILLILLVMFGPPVVLIILGVNKRKDKPTTANVLFILAAVYVLIGGGICASILNGLSNMH